LLKKAEKRKKRVFFMDKCTIKIKTTVDDSNQESTFQGEYCVGESVTLCYRDNGAQVRVTIQDTSAIVERTGDYGMLFTLTPNQTTQGVLSIGGYSGDVQTKTQQVECRVLDDEIFILLRYALVTGAEEQQMKLFITARKEKTNERNRENSV
jgi:uncharacterized beta-barrel protein YwiB (DUF1934 family)